MIEIRDIKIDLVLGNENPIVDLFNDITKDLQIIKCNVYNKDGLEFVYYNKKKEWIFYQDFRNSNFWTHYKRYWVFFEEKLSLQYKEIQAITKYLVEDALKREVGKPLDAERYLASKVEDALKREVGTPIYKIDNIYNPVEDVLKRELEPTYTTAEIDWKYKI